MKIGIYQQTSGGLGGSEFLAAVMAQTLKARHEVEIVHHWADYSPCKLAAHYGVDLDGVRVRHVASDPAGTYGLKRYLPPTASTWRRWNASASEPYDLFIANVHFLPPHCHAPAGVLYVLFPLFVRGEAWPSVPPRAGARGVIDRIRRRSFEADWPWRFGGYQTKLAISHFAADWTERRWGQVCGLLYPPMPDGSRARSAKADAIVSLARINSWKQQIEMARAFGDHIHRHAPGWELAFVGGVGDTTAEREYLAELRAVAAGLPVRIVANASRAEVEAELARAKIFWHVMGLGIDPDVDPLRIEHFGIATVEGMAAGCVPVVLNKGGQAEIVIDGECGYTAGDAETMAGRIVDLTRDPALLDRMSVAAQVRAADFSREKFAARLLDKLGLKS